MAADPIVIEWGALATEIVKNAVVGSSAAALTAIIMRKRPSPAPLTVQGRCSSHQYMERDQIYIKNHLRWQASLLYRICEKLGIVPPAEPIEESVQDKRAA